MTSSEVGVANSDLTICVVSAEDRDQHHGASLPMKQGMKGINQSAIAADIGYDAGR